MKTVFLAYAFRDQDRDLVSSVEQLLESHDVRPTTGKHLGGGPLDEVVMGRIDKADGLVALLTRCHELSNGGWTTSDWVKDELDYARNQKKRAVALVEAEVLLSGRYGNREKIPLDRQNLSQAILDLSATIGLWKREAGRTLTVAILPDELACLAGGGSGIHKCYYRFFARGRFTKWKQVTLFPEPGGTFVQLEGVCDDHMIQLKIEEKRRITWLSACNPQRLHIRLKRQGGDQ